MRYTRQQIEAFWIMFLRTPAHETPDTDGMFDLGEIHEAACLRFTRMTPYSVAEPKHETKTYPVTIRR